jgi:hypothetical protein
MPSTAKYQCAEFIDQSILLLWVVVRKIYLQFLEEFPFATLLAFQAEADERRDSFALAHVNYRSVPLHLIGETRC